MKLISLNVGLPREIVWEGQTIRTGIYKEPVAGPVFLRTLNLDGDGQADLTVHGGRTKAAYVYPAEHYSYWKTQFPDRALPFGMFGENFTIEGVDEEAVCIGDRFSIGKAKVIVTEPRMPCYKLGIRFGRMDMLKRFLKSGRTGFYFGVLEEGIVETGDEVTFLDRDASGDTMGLKVADVTRLYSTERNNKELLARAISVKALPETWRIYFQEMLNKLER